MGVYFRDLSQNEQMKVAELFKSWFSTDNVNRAQLCSYKLELAVSWTRTIIAAGENLEKRYGSLLKIMTYNFDDIRILMGVVDMGWSWPHLKEACESQMTTLKICRDTFKDFTELMNTEASSDQVLKKANEWLPKLEAEMKKY